MDELDLFTKYSHLLICPAKVQRLKNFFSDYENFCIKKIFEAYILWQ